MVEKASKVPPLDLPTLYVQIKKKKNNPDLELLQNKLYYMCKRMAYPTVSGRTRELLIIVIDTALHVTF